MSNERWMTAGGKAREPIRLKSSTSGKNGTDRLKENHHVQPRGVMLDVIQILFGMEVHRFVAAAVDLPPAGRPGRNREPLPLPGFVLLHQVRHFRPRANQAHFAPENVEELRETRRGWSFAENRPAASPGDRLGFYE